MRRTCEPGPIVAKISNELPWELLVCRLMDGWADPWAIGTHNPWPTCRSISTRGWNTGRAGRSLLPSSFAPLRKRGMQDFPQICLVNTPCDISFEGPFQAPFIDFGHSGGQGRLVPSCPRLYFWRFRESTNSVNYWDFPREKFISSEERATKLVFYRMMLSFKCRSKNWKWVINT